MLSGVNMHHCFDSQISSAEATLAEGLRKHPFSYSLGKQHMTYRTCFLPIV